MLVEVPQTQAPTSAQASSNMSGGDEEQSDMVVPTAVPTPVEVEHGDETGYLSPMSPPIEIERGDATTEPSSVSMPAVEASPVFTLGAEQVTSASLPEDLICTGSTSLDEDPVFAGEVSLDGETGKDSNSLAQSELEIAEGQVVAPLPPGGGCVSERSAEDSELELCIEQLRQLKIQDSPSEHSSDEWELVAPWENKEGPVIRTLWNGQSRIEKIRSAFGGWSFG